LYYATSITPSFQIFIFIFSFSLLHLGVFYLEKKTEYPSLNKLSRFKGFFKYITGKKFFNALIWIVFFSLIRFLWHMGIINSFFFSLIFSLVSLSRIFSIGYFNFSSFQDQKMYSDMNIYKDPVNSSRITNIKGSGLKENVVAMNISDMLNPEKGSGSNTGSSSGTSTVGQNSGNRNPQSQVSGNQNPGRQISGSVNPRPLVSNSGNPQPSARANPQVPGGMYIPIQPSPSGNSQPSGSTYTSSPFTTGQVTGSGNPQYSAGANSQVPGGMYTPIQPSPRGNSQPSGSMYIPIQPAPTGYSQPSGSMFTRIQPAPTGYSQPTGSTYTPSTFTPSTFTRGQVSGSQNGVPQNPPYPLGYNTQTSGSGSQNNVTYTQVPWQATFNIKGEFVITDSHLSETRLHLIKRGHAVPSVQPYATSLANALEHFNNTGQGKLRHEERSFLRSYTLEYWPLHLKKRMWEQLLEENFRHGDRNLNQKLIYELRNLK